MPEGVLSDNARRVIAGTPAAAWLEEGAARSIESVAEPVEVIAIDCDLPDAVRWSLDCKDPDGIAEELRRWVLDLVEHR